MKNTRQVDFEERVQIAKECYESGNNYGEIAKNTISVTSKLAIGR